MAGTDYCILLFGLCHSICALTHLYDSSYPNNTIEIIIVLVKVSSRTALSMNRVMNTNWTLTTVTLKVD